MPTKHSSPATDKKYLQMGLGIVVALIIAAWFFRSWLPLFKAPGTGTGSSAVAKTACARFAGTEKTDCETRLTESDKLTAIVAAAAAKWDVKPCDTVADGAKADCRDIVSYESVMKSKNAKDCDPIKDKNMHDTCKKNLGAASVAPIPAVSKQADPNAPKIAEPTDAKQATPNAPKKPVPEKK